METLDLLWSDLTKYSETEDCKVLTKLSMILNNEILLKRNAEHLVEQSTWSTELKRNGTPSITHMLQNI